MSKSQILRLGEPSLYSNQSDEVSCIEYLDLASFVAYVNSGQPWNLKSSLLLSGRETMAIREDNKIKGSRVLPEAGSQNTVSVEASNQL